LLCGLAWHDMTRGMFVAALIYVLCGTQDNYGRQRDRRDLPGGGQDESEAATREAQLAIRDTGRAKEADLPVAVPGTYRTERAEIIDTGPKSIRMPHPGMDSGVASHRWRV